MIPVDLPPKSILRQKAEQAVGQWISETTPAGYVEAMITGQQVCEMVEVFCLRQGASGMSITTALGLLRAAMQKTQDA